MAEEDSQAMEIDQTGVTGLIAGAAPFILELHETAGGVVVRDWAAIGGGGLALAIGLLLATRANKAANKQSAWVVVAGCVGLGTYQLLKGFVLL